MKCCAKAGIFDPDGDGEAGRYLQVLGRMQVAERELDRQRQAAGDQDFGVLVAQQVVQAREEAFDFVLALRHFGGLVGLQDVGAGGGRHAQRLGEDAGQRADAEVHGQLVIAGDPAVVAQDWFAARRAQRQAAVLAVARLAVVFVLAPRAFNAAKTKHLEHVRLLLRFISGAILRSADFSRARPVCFLRTV
jgi:hypothetical protein